MMLRSALCGGRVIVRSTFSSMKMVLSDCDCVFGLVVTLQNECDASCLHSAVSNKNYKLKLCCSCCWSQVQFTHTHTDRAFTSYTLKRLFFSPRILSHNTHTVLLHSVSWWYLVLKPPGWWRQINEPKICSTRNVKIIQAHTLLWVSETERRRETEAVLLLFLWKMSHKAGALSHFLLLSPLSVDVGQHYAAQRSI